MNAERYNRQIILHSFGMESQQKLQNAKVLVIGAGGLGIPVLTYLNAMGVGTLGIVEQDTVSTSNLHRQVLYGEKEVGQPKIQVAINKLQAQNSSTKLISHTTFIDPKNALEIIGPYDVVVDASDNFPTRYLVNDACVLLQKPLIYGALHGFEGQLSVFNYNNGPTYRCLFPKMPGSNEVPNCDENGVLGVLPGIIGNLQALETVKVITGIGEVLSGKLLLFDGLFHSSQKIKFALIPDNLKINKLRDNYDFECTIDTNVIEAKEFLKLLNTKEITVIDVRTPKEFHESHLESTKNIPLADIESRFEEIALEKMVYVICQSGVRSKKAITVLQKRLPKIGFIHVNGGMNFIRSHAADH